MTDGFDTSRLGNAGKEAARAHKQLRKVSEKLQSLTDEAIKAGLSSKQIEQSFLKFCSTHEQTIDAASLFLAVEQVAAKKAGVENL